MIQDVDFFEMLVNFYQTIRRYFAGGSHLDSEKLKSHNYPSDSNLLS